VSQEGKETQGLMGSKEGYDACTIRFKESEDKDEDDNASKSNTKIGWSSLIVRKDSLHNYGKQWASGTKGNSILLDNGSALSLFGNSNMVTNIRESKTTLELATNAGTNTNLVLGTKASKSA
jgi:hypothetical protein